VGFRELSEDMDALVLDGLGDMGTVGGREIAGFFSAPWLQPRMGRINTALREPQFEIRVSDASGMSRASWFLLICRRKTAADSTTW